MITFHLSLNREYGVREDFGFRSQAAWVWSWLPGWWQSLTLSEPPFPRAQEKITTVRTARRPLMPQWAGTWSTKPGAGTQKTLLLTLKILTINSSLCQPTPISKAQNSQGLLDPSFSCVSYTHKHCDLSCDVCCHPPWCDSFMRDSQGDSFNCAHILNLPCTWREGLLHLGIGEKFPDRI